LSPTVFRKLFENNEIYNEILLTIFPEKKTLQLLLNDFKEKAKSKKIYETLSQTIENKINKGT